MALTFNDLMTRGWITFHATGGANDIITAPIRVMALAVETNAANEGFRLYDAVTVTGNPKTTLINDGSAGAGSAFQHFGPAGVPFTTGVSSQVESTPVRFIIYYIAD